MAGNADLTNARADLVLAVADTLPESLRKATEDLIQRLDALNAKCKSKGA